MIEVKDALNCCPGVETACASALTGLVPVKFRLSAVAWQLAQIIDATVASQPRTSQPACCAAAIGGFNW